jgi:hypothetical protein
LMSNHEVSVFWSWTSARVPFSYSSHCLRHRVSVLLSSKNHSFVRPFLDALQCELVVGIADSIGFMTTVNRPVSRPRSDRPTIVPFRSVRDRRLR